MVIRFSDTTKIPVSEGTIWDYPMATKDLGISFQKLNGRGPKKGQYLNTICHEIYFIIKGTAVFYIQGKEYEAGAKDVVVVEPNVAHYFVANNIEYITITRPDWYEEQYKQVEE